MKAYRRYFTCVLIVLVSLLALSVKDASCFGLKSKVQDEIDQNPFLKTEGIKLRVTDEKNGYVTIEMYEGDNDIRKNIIKGTSVLKLHEFFDMGKPYYQSVQALQQSIDVLQKIDGVKSIMLTAVADSAFDGSVMIPVTRMTECFYLINDKNKKKDLGFKLRVDRFDINKNFRTDVTILEEGKEVLRDTIELSKPLVYKNYIFSFATYEPYSSFKVDIQNNKTNKSTSLTMEYQKKIKWEEDNSTLGIINAEANDEVGKGVVTKAKIWFSDGKGEPSLFWLDLPGESTIQRTNNDYKLNVSQMFAVGLTVKIDKSK